MVDALHKFIYDDEPPPAFEGMNELSDSPIIPFEGFEGADYGVFEKNGRSNALNPA